jgi:hypothetical protein
MKKLVLGVVFLAAGSLLADSDTNSFCNIFECKSQNAVHVRAEWTPTIQKVCDSYKNIDGTYSSKFCNMVDFSSDGSVILKDLYVESFRKLCVATVSQTEEEEADWLTTFFQNISSSKVFWTH